MNNGLKELAAKLVLASYESYDLNPDETEFFRRYQPAGVTLFKRNVPDPFSNLKAKCDALQALRDESRPPFIVAIDQEGGRVRRIGDPFVNRGAAQSLEGGRTDDSSLKKIEEYGLELGAKLKELGVNVNFAPVCDILTEPENQAIGDRVFGVDAEAVTLRAGAFLRGMQTSGVKGCLKHFPGQGDAKFDTHKVSCEIKLSRQTLEERELIPFKKLRKDVTMIMMSHCVYPAFENCEAGTSKVVIQDYLQGELGYQGLVLSDDLIMEALPQESGAWSDGVVRSVEAGVDLLLVCRDLAKTVLAVEALAEKAGSDSDFLHRLELSAAKIEKFRLSL